MEAGLIKICVALAAGLILKIAWDWLTSGRTEKGIYVKAAECEHHRETCCIGQVKRDTIYNRRQFDAFKEKTDTRLDGVEKRLDQGAADFRVLRKDIGEIKEFMAGCQVRLDSLIHGKGQS